MNSTIAHPSRLKLVLSPVTSAVTAAERTGCNCKDLEALYLKVKARIWT